MRPNADKVFNMGEMIDTSLLSDLVTVGAVGFLAGVLFPFIFRFVGYIVDSVKVVIRG